MLLTGRPPPGPGAAGPRCPVPAADAVSSSPAASKRSGEALRGRPAPCPCRQPPRNSPRRRFLPGRLTLVAANAEPGWGEGEACWRSHPRWPLRTQELVARAPCPVQGTQHIPLPTTSTAKVPFCPLGADPLAAWGRGRGKALGVAAPSLRRAGHSGPGLATAGCSPSPSSPPGSCTWCSRSCGGRGCLRPASGSPASAPCRWPAAWSREPRS